MATKHRTGLRRHLREATSFFGMVAPSALAVLLAQHMLTPPQARAQSAPGSSVCSNATLNGTYGVQAFGTYLTGPDGTPLAAPAWRSQANLVLADGSGNASRSGGVAGTLPQPATGTYVVNADCTFTVTWISAGSTHVSGVLVNGGSKAFIVPTPDGNSAITWERQ